MKKVGGLFTCPALALMAFAALPLSAAELAHRWSFNGDYSDSVGGADAVKCGTYVWQSSLTLLAPAGGGIDRKKSV